MPQFLFDTDHVTLYQLRHPVLLRRFLSCPSGDVGVSAVNVEEVLRGRLAKLSRRLNGTARAQAYAQLASSVQMLQQFPIVEFDQASEAHFQQIQVLKLRIGTRDQKIAAIALAHNLTLLTRNRRDFAQIPGVQLDDWTT